MERPFPTAYVAAYTVAVVFLVVVLKVVVFGTATSTALFLLPIGPVVGWTYRNRGPWVLVAALSILATWVVGLAVYAAWAAGLRRT
ncbi:MAG: hypothetical protein JHD16_00775 [Solirubrobacteraceae bacterium]|nr:hypothetical protein [Solirubrobacteraceae bacterium]